VLASDIAELNQNDAEEYKNITQTATSVIPEAVRHQLLDA